MKEAVNLCDMLCYRSSALFNVSEMFLIRHATEHAVRVGVAVQEPLHLSAQVPSQVTQPLRRHVPAQHA